ncbi:MAG: serine hydrolase [Bacteroidetes bacterium]|nr:MAG: serine hydrolase [Bacteroidota bacterium]
MKHLQILAILISFLVFSCSSTNDEIPNENESDLGLYFPPVNSNEWETQTVNELGWNDSAMQALFSLLEEKDTKAFMILKDGKIVVENYFNGGSSTDDNAWNSAGKTLSAFTIGIAQQEGFLDISNPSKDYLGSNWSNLTTEQEQNITVFNHLTMTTGLDYTNILLQNCTLPSCFNYLNEPSSFWYYHNGAYTLTQNIVEGAIGSDFSAYFNSKLRDRIGMQGEWVSLGFNSIYFSTARSMARFGLLNLNQGIWEDTVVLNDINYFIEMTNTSQNLNKSYGYLWWLNGKESFRSPGLTLEFQGSLIINAPDDLIAALGKNDQKLYIVPSQNLVIVRMGGDAGEALLGPSSFDNDLWEKINALIN